jgi:hypothetical protein
LLTGALSRPAPPAAAPPGAGPADPAATQTLEEAIDRLSRIAWMEATVWQQLACDEVAYQAQGRYLAGPDNRLRLDLQVRLGRSRAEMLAVSDGTTLWQSSRVAGGERSVSRVELAKVLQALATPGVALQVRDEFFQTQCIAGLCPMLKGLRARMSASRQEEVLWNGRAAHRLTLHWSGEQAAALAAAGAEWPAYLPRRCVLYLDAASLWPVRLEWWGPGAEPGPDTQLLQVEYRDPVLNRPLSPEECAREFAFDPGPGAVHDDTREMTEMVETRARELAARK